MDHDAPVVAVNRCDERRPRIGFDEAPSLLTFETERALVARAGMAATDGTFPLPMDGEGSAA